MTQLPKAKRAVTKHTGSKNTVTKLTGTQCLILTAGAQRAGNLAMPLPKGLAGADLPLKISPSMAKGPTQERGRTMKRARFTEEQIIGILQEHETGAKCPDLCREHGISEGTFYAWKSKFGGMTVSEAKRLKALERAMVRHWSEDNGEGEWQAEAVAGGDDAGHVSDARAFGKKVVGPVV